MPGIGTVPHATAPIPPSLRIDRLEQNVNAEHKTGYSEDLKLFKRYRTRDNAGKSSYIDLTVELSRAMYTVAVGKLAPQSDVMVRGQSACGSVLTQSGLRHR